ncbi:MAG: sugar kinase [Anaeroplasmataceae bacterium]|nr:sugar kinase [Anaeroplasma bactoclasticum]MCM1195893.1 sugar kinase [Roseburia sp.]MCM1556238.1 sugar kinase [Anaeroplasma bactoclasticum]MDE6661270.1 sugar kinase [Anaeroplasmataceae bacterium]MDE7105902.1 sugar kinase [Anaeroplasmataceae bacterium]
MAKVVTMGEIMLRLSPAGNTRFVQADSFDVIYGGGEANVAVSCANYGHDAYFVSKLPEHEIGQAAVNALRRYGVNTKFIARGGDRVGIYYAETGASMRPSKVIYDRANSAIAEAKPEDFDFDAIMEGADWFHWSGITPAISNKAAELTRLACEAAKRHGVTVSVDLNFRKKLWTSKKAISIMKPLMQYVDVCIGNEEDAELCLGFKPDANVEAGETGAEGYHKIFEQMAKEFGFKYVISTLRESFSATHNGWKALIYNGKEFYESKRYDINPIIDRIGGGDSFSGGIIHGLLTKATQGEALEFAVAASALKHTINGDFNLVSASEVESLAGGNANGRVQR